MAAVRPVDAAAKHPSATTGHQTSSGGETVALERDTDNDDTSGRCHRYDFYALLRGSAAPIPLAERWSCVGPAPFPGEVASSAPRRTSTCFEYHAAPKRSWVGSEAACLSRGMHLASLIHY